MKYSNWQLKRRYEEIFRKSIESIFKPYFEKLNDTADPMAILNFLRKMANDERFSEYCNAVSYKMVTMLEHQNLKTWRKAASKGSRGHDIYNAIKKELSPNNASGIYSAIAEQAMNNASLIKSVPYDMAADFVGYIQNETLKGLRSLDIAHDLHGRFKEYSKSRINLIARTETSKTQSVLTQARAEKLGLNWYIWRTSKDSRVRKSHDVMDGVLVKWSDPPNPEKLAGAASKSGNYHAGMIYNCRCYSEPVIDIDFVNFPHKVYSNGSIKSMTRNQFEHII